MLTGKWYDESGMFPGEWPIWEYMEDDDVADVVGPAIGVRRRLDGMWEIGIYGWDPSWREYPEVKTLEEAKATAIAIWQTT